MFNISIFGGGYIGTVSGGCLSKLGNKVTIVEKDRKKIELLNRGIAPIVEPGIDGLIKTAYMELGLKATSDAETAVLNSDVSFVCVGTPSTIEGELCIDYIFNVMKNIGSALKKKDTFHVIAVRSTIVPGTIQKCIQIIEQISKKNMGVDFSVCSNPEFLREGSAIDDYFNPPYTLIGAYDAKAANTLKIIYSRINADIHIVEVREAELIKYINNAFHALKVGFANEVGLICKKLGIDSHKLMALFCLDKKLNLSDSYLKPGFAFGGSCLSKDLRALTYISKKQNLKTPILNNIIPSNENIISHVFSMIEATKNSNVGIIGLAFKKGTDDLRESPLVSLTERLIGKGYEVKVYDPSVSEAKLFGANKEYAISHIKHLEKCLVDEDELDKFIEFADTLVIGSSYQTLSKYSNGLFSQSKQVIDLVRYNNSIVSNGNYTGIAW